MLIVLPAAAFAQNVDEATSRVEFSGAGLFEWEIQNSTYEVFDIWPIGEPYVRTMLLRQVESKKRASGMEGSLEPRIKVDAFYLSAKGLTTPIWSLDVMAHEGGARPFWHVYVATVWGCCDDTVPADIYFSLLNGRHLLTANGPAISFSVPNSGGLMRLAGIETPWSMSPFHNPELAPEFTDRKDILGIVGYASPFDRIERIAVIANNANVVETSGMWNLPELTWIPDAGSEPVRDLLLQPLNSERGLASIAGVSLRVAFKPDVWVEIPISGDRLDIENASMSEPLTLERLQP